MCGICGVWGSIQPEIIEGMVSAMHHRGPDDSGIYHNESVSLGMARLAIIDLSPAGNQPMSTPDENIWIVFNGEVYNFQTEREILVKAGYTFKSATDTEVVLRMYEHYGDDFLLRLRGMFTLAIYDRIHNRLLIARDHLGIKPLLYTQVGERLIFASELKALLATDLVQREINPDALRQLLTYGSVTQPNTMLSNVFMLLPAHRMIIENGQQRIERYWSLGVNRRPELNHASYEEQTTVLLQELETCVQLQMVSDVPLGAFLSGGTDSSILVALMARIAGKRIKTFSVGFEADGHTFDERSIAQRTADFVGTDHTDVLITAEDARNHIEHIAYGLDQPSIDGVNTYFVSMAARRGMTVAISGTGGDELFAGYPWFWQMAAVQPPSPIQYLRGTMSRMLPDHMVRGRLWRWRQQGHFLERFAQTYHIFGAHAAAEILAPHLRFAANAGRAHTYDIKPLDELSGHGAIERVSALCLRGYTNNQLLRDIDATSMAHSLEVRVPYLDPVLTDIALSLPPSTKLNTSLSRSSLPLDATYDQIGAKKILIDAAHDLLPPNFGNQPKRGFTLPFAAWMHGPLNDILRESLSDNRIRQRGLFELNYTQQIRDSFLAGNGPWTYTWLLMMIELWQQQVMDQPAIKLRQGFANPQQVIQ